MEVLMKTVIKYAPIAMKEPDKTILPFCTHEGSGMGRSEADIQKACPGAKVEKGLAIQGAGVKGAESEIERWLKGYGV